MTDIDYPVKTNDIKKFEQLNSNIAVNVYGYEDKVIFALRISNLHKRQHSVDSLFK